MILRNVQIEPFAVTEWTDATVCEFATNSATLFDHAVEVFPFVILIGENKNPKVYHDQKNLK